MWRLESLDTLDMRARLHHFGSLLSLTRQRSVCNRQPGPPGALLIQMSVLSFLLRFSHLLALVVLTIFAFTLPGSDPYEAKDRVLDHNPAGHPHQGDRRGLPRQG